MSAGYLDKLFGLQGDIAVVIGGTGVLCGAQAQGLARAGAFVIVAGRNAEAGAVVVDAITAEGGGAEFRPVDVAQRDSIQTLVDDVVSAHGKVDIVIHGAGVNHAGNYLELADDDWTRVLRANLDGVHYGCQIFGKQMVGQPGGGAMINIASVSAHTPLSRVFAYSASKAAVVNLTQNVAREFAQSGVRVNALCPGFFPAEQNRKILDPERIAKILARTPMNRFGEPEELIGATLLLAARGAGSFVTGTTLYVDGGFTGMSL